LLISRRIPQCFDLTGKLVPHRQRGLCPWRFAGVNGHIRTTDTSGLYPHQSLPGVTNGDVDFFYSQFLGPNQRNAFKAECSFFYLLPLVKVMRFSRR
jgi:hypothetical protein